MKSSFFLHSSNEYYFDDINLEKTINNKFRNLISAFTSNMTEVLFSVQTPFNLVTHSELQILHNKNILLAHADALRNNYDDDNDKIIEKAKTLTDATMADREKRRELIDSITNRLSILGKDEAIRKSNEATLRQSIVIMWSSVESILRDFLKLHLNSNYEIASNFFESELTAKYWSKKQISFDQLKYFKFDLSNQMGNVALDINPCSNLRAIKAAYSWILKNQSNCLEIINCRDFYLFYKLRNLIAHRNGVVDQQYIEETNYCGALGERLEITPDDFSDYYQLSKKLVTSLATEGNNILNS